MKTKKITTIELIADGRKREFELEHAENLLRMKNNGGWKIADEDKYILTEYGIEYKKATEPGNKKNDTNDNTD